MFDACKDKNESHFTMEITAIYHFAAHLLLFGGKKLIKGCDLMHHHCLAQLNVIFFALAHVHVRGHHMQPTILALFLPERP